MTTLATFLCLTPLLLGLVSLIAPREDRRWLIQLTFAGWIGCFALLLAVNNEFPFAGGGDDESYFFLAGMPIEMFADVYDLTRLADRVAQPGYPWVLSLLHHFSGADLVSLKLFNVACFIILIPLWYRIGTDLESREFGRATAIAILFLTPLWYSWMFLLKDIVIVLLQSVFLLSVVKVQRAHQKKIWLLLLFSTLALIPFRSPLVLLNMATLVGAGALTLATQREGKTRVWILILSTAVILSILSIASDPSRMAAVGVISTSRIIGIENTTDFATQMHETSSLQALSFPLLYLFSETTGFNPQTWTEFDSFSLRGVLAIPWILMVVPFSVLGLVSLTRCDPRIRPGRGIIARFLTMRLAATPWGGLVVFILSYMLVSWTVGDTTRWRIADMPVIATVAVAGWWATAPRLRLPYLAMLSCVGAFSFSLYYLARNL